MPPESEDKLNAYEQVLVKIDAVCMALQLHEPGTEAYLRTCSAIERLSMAARHLQFMREEE